MYKVCETYSYSSTPDLVGAAWPKAKSCSMSSQSFFADILGKCIGVVEGS